MNYCKDCKHIQWGDTCMVTSITKIDPITKGSVLTNINVGQIKTTRKKFITEGPAGLYADYYSTPCPYFTAK